MHRTRFSLRSSKAIMIERRTDEETTENDKEIKVRAANIGVDKPERLSSRTRPRQASVKFSERVALVTVGSSHKFTPFGFSKPDYPSSPLTSHSLSNQR